MSQESKNFSNKKYNTNAPEPKDGYCLLAIHFGFEVSTCKYSTSYEQPFHNLSGNSATDKSNNDGGGHARRYYSHRIS
jgi:ribosomal protein RSM22 (predicted rRNA methylase)